MIADGVADLVGAARGLIAEPELVRHALEGREEESRTCIACNWCMAAGHGPVAAWGCAINPATTRERRWGARLLTRAETERRVVVVGGGPAGLEAARIAALRGHAVTLLERSDALGGQLRLWSALPERGAIAAATEWYSGRVDALGVDVRLGTEATLESVVAERPDAVVLATGSAYSRSGASGFLSQPIPGHERPFVYTPEQIIRDGARPSGRVVVLDDEGFNTGPGVAELLAAGGAEVELMTRWMQPVENAVYTLEFAFIIPRLSHAGVKVSTQTYIKEIRDGSLTVFDVFTNYEEERTGVDAVVLATMREPVSTALSAPDLEDHVAQVFTIGDATSPRGLAEATYEGQRFARMIGEPGAPSTFIEAFLAPRAADVAPRPADTLAGKVVSVG